MGEVFLLPAALWKCSLFFFFKGAFLMDSNEVTARYTCTSHIGTVSGVCTHGV